MPSKTRRSESGRRLPASVVLCLSPDDVARLRDVAHQYEQVMGFARHVVVRLSPRHIRRRYRFIVQESAELDKTLDGLTERSEPSELRLSIDQAVAFWGRLLANIRTKRSRRRLSAEEIDARERLAVLLQDAIAAQRPSAARVVGVAIQSRRRTEREWMTEALGG